jgi:hypothetical protein
MRAPTRPAAPSAPVIRADAISHFASPYSRCFSNLSSTNRTKQKLIVHFFLALIVKLEICVTKQRSAKIK